MLSGKIFRDSALGEVDGQRPWRTEGGLVYRAAVANLYVTNGRTVEEGYDAGHPEYRVPYEGKLYDPKGVYIATENIDKTFIKTRFERFANENVKAYLFQADKGSAYFKRDKYSRTGWKCELVKGKKAKDEDDFAEGDEKMLDLIDWLTGKPSEKDIRETFDMDSLNSYLTGALLATHWDSLVSNRNNDFLMYWKRDVLDCDMRPVLDKYGKNVEEKKWYVITWDLDNTLWDKSNGSDLQNPYKEWFSNYIYEPARKDSKKTVLIETVYNDEENAGIRSVYRDGISRMFKGFYSEKEYDEEVDGLMNRVGDAIEDTRRKVFESGWMTEWNERNNPQDFEDIKDHARERRSRVGSQL